MRKIVMLVLAVVLLAGLIGADTGFALTRLTAKNTSNKEIQFRLISVENNTEYPLVATLDLGHPGDPFEKDFDVPVGKYALTATGRTVKVENGKVVYGDWQTCFGEIDGALWDKYRAERIVNLEKGKRTLRFTTKSCQTLSIWTRAYWQDLATKIFKYNLKKEEGYFDY